MEDLVTLRQNCLRYDSTCRLRLFHCLAILVPKVT